MDGIKWYKKVKTEALVIFFAIFAISILIFAIKANAAIIQSEIVTARLAQDDYFALNDKYLQVERVGDLEVHVYETPTGHGYQIINHYNDRIESIAYGDSSEDYTFIRYNADVEFLTSTTSKR